jgi:hypothetical protein
MTLQRKLPTATHFLNVDPDIYSKDDLQPLVSALGRRVLVLFAGRIRRTYVAHLELARITTTPDSSIRGFCTLIKALPKTGRGLWNAAKARDFSIGVQAAMQPASSDFVVAAETVKAASEIGARIVFTVYAPAKAGNASDSAAM